MIQKKHKKNIFNTSTKYLGELQNLSIKAKNSFAGKSIAVIFLTKICPVGCEFCYCASDTVNLEFPEKQEISDEGLEKIIEFVNYTNNGYFMISGGGEPFEKFEYIIEIIKKIKTEKIVIATSGIWAKNREEAERILRKIIHAKKSRKKDVDIELRISVDKFHCAKIGTQSTENIINFFEKEIAEKDNLKLFFLTMQDDETPIEIIKKRNELLTIKKFISNNSIKKRNKRYVLETNRGLEILVEEATLFYSNIKCDLENPDTSDLIKAKNALLENITFTKKGNLSKVEYQDGTIGIDYMINYNGNVTTWGNYHRENAPNIYINAPNEISNQLYSDILSYSFIDKGFMKISEIVTEVNPTAVRRAISINIRDFTGAALLEENKTALYVAVSLLQEYLQEGIVKTEDMNGLSRELKKTIFSKRRDIKDLYSEASYTIFDQINEKPFDKGVWEDTLELLQLGHYDMTRQEYSRIKKMYKWHIDKSPQITMEANQNARLIARFAPMNHRAELFFRNKYLIKAKNNE